MDIPWHVIVIVVVLVLVGGYWLYTRPTAAATTAVVTGEVDASKVGTAPSALQLNIKVPEGGTAPKTINCADQQVLNKTKTYYDQKTGQNMTPVFTRPIGNIQCDVRYTAAPGGVDARRFTYQSGPNGWYVVNMGGSQSGVTVMQ